MKILLPEEREKIPNYVFTEGFLSDDQCNLICKEMLSIRSSEFEYATIGGNKENHYSENLEYRTVKSATIGFHDMAWLYDILKDEIIKVNEIFKFDLSGIIEPFQILDYEVSSNDSIPNGIYKWHQDANGGYSSFRKISVTVQLSNPEDYDGCRLELFTDGIYTPSQINRGTMITFPSYLPHQVTEITRGRRIALVTWISGPQFK